MSIRNEGAALRPFSGVDAVEHALAENIKLNVIASGRTDELRVGETYFFDKSELLRCGLEIVFGDIDEIKSAASRLCQSDEDADFVIVAEDGVRSALKTSQVLGKGSLSDLPPSIQLAKAVEINVGPVMGHPHASRTISFHLVSNKTIATVDSTKARVRGAILASASFDLVVQPSNEALQPRELTDKLRSNWSLTSQTWFHFKAEGELLECETLDEAFQFYVDKEMLDAYPGASKEYRQIFEIQLFSLVTSQIVASVHKALKLNPVGNKLPATSAVVRLFNSIFSGSRSLMKNWPTKLIEDPERLLSEALAAGGTSKKILEILKLEDSGNEEVEND